MLPQTVVVVVVADTLGAQELQELVLAHLHLLLHLFNNSDIQEEVLLEVQLIILVVEVEEVLVDQGQMLLVETLGETVVPECNSYNSRL
jgi:hypothetical protein